MSGARSFAELRRGALALSAVPGLGPVSFARLVEAFGSIPAILATPPDALAATGGLAPATAAGVASALDRHGRWADEEMAKVEKMKAAVIAYGEPDYPALVAALPDPPCALWVRGDPRVLARDAVAIVGSRRATPYGMEQSERFAYGLARAGLVVTSGLARGIDAVAHEGALLAGGFTVAVLGSGLDVSYPRENGRLADRIAERGAIVTEHPLGTPPLAGHFPRRNRILAGLTWGVLVVEASTRSGSLITAKIALEVGREVFVIPGRIDSVQSRGTLELAKEGAHLATDVGDILGELPASCRLEPASARPEDGPKRFELDPVEARLLDAMKGDASSLEGLVASSGLPPAELLPALTALSIKGAVEALPGARYRKRGLAVR